MPRGHISYFKLARQIGINYIDESQGFSTPALRHFQRTEKYLLQTQQLEHVLTQCNLGFINNYLQQKPP